jgi:hypothetical protein
MALGSWTRITGSISGSASASLDFGYEWTVLDNSDRVTNNRSTVQVRMWLYRKNTSWNPFDLYDRTSNITIDGTSTNQTTRYDTRQLANGTRRYCGVDTAVFPKGSVRQQYVNHGTDGKKTATISATLATTASSMGTVTASSSVVLPQIWRTFATPASVTFATPTYGSAETCSWASVSGATQYRLEYQLDGGTWTLETEQAGTSYEVPSARFNNMGTIRYRVRVNQKDGWYASGWAYSSTRTIAKASQTAPSAPSLSDITANSITATSAGNKVRRGAEGAGYDSPKIFGSLSPNTEYSFYAYKAETTTHLQSPNSTAATDTTLSDAHESAGGDFKVYINDTIENRRAIKWFDGTEWKRKRLYRWTGSEWKLTHRD